MVDGEQKKKSKYLVSFNAEWSSSYVCIQKSRKGGNSAFCSICHCDFGIGHGGENDIKRHISTPKYKSFVTAQASNHRLTDWGSSASTSNFDIKVTKAEVLFSGFLTEHNLPLTTADHAGNLFRQMFPDSKKAAKYRCGRTKTTHILTGAVAKENIEEVSKEITSVQWFGIATDGSSDKTDWLGCDIHVGYARY